MLLINNVTKKYGSFTALEEITLELNNGVYGLLAPNGAGKTTLLNMIATLSFPTHGEITWDGIDIVELDEKYRGILGFLPQKFGYYRNYTPEQFLKYMAVLKGIEKCRIRFLIDDLLEKVGLFEVRDKKMKKFSGGMIQRVGIAQALLNNPRILILDEPTAGLDPKERVRFRNMIRELSGDRIILFSTHIVSDIETIADKIVMLRNHKLFCFDTLENICRRLEGKIFELPVDAAVACDYMHLYERQTSQGTVKRIFCEEAPDLAAGVIPNLEDVFLVAYGDEGVAK